MASPERSTPSWKSRIPCALALALLAPSPAHAGGPCGVFLPTVAVYARYALPVHGPVALLALVAGFVYRPLLRFALALVSLSVITALLMHAGDYLVPSVFNWRTRTTIFTAVAGPVLLSLSHCLLRASRRTV